MALILPKLFLICISDIVNGGAISQFVAMARSSTQGKLRTMAVEAIRILSEDNLKSGNTRLRLCEDGAAGALGRVLKDDVEGDGSDGILVRLANDQQDNYHDGLVTSHDESVIKELHQALCAWTNILDRNEKASNTFVLSNQVSSASIIEGAEEILVKGCSEFLETGGLESLLYVATLPIRHITVGSVQRVWTRRILLSRLAVLWRRFHHCCCRVAQLQEATQLAP